MACLFVLVCLFVCCLVGLFVCLFYGRLFVVFVVFVGWFVVGCLVVSVAVGCLW